MVGLIQTTSNVEALRDTSPTPNKKKSRKNKKTADNNNNALNNFDAADDSDVVFR